MRRAARIDDNHAGIVSALRQAGCMVLSLAAVGNGCPDLLVSRNGVNTLLEVKDGGKSPSKRKLTDDQVIFFDTWKGPAFVVVDVAQAFEACGI